MLNESRIFSGVFKIYQLCMLYGQQSITYQVYHYFSKWLGRAIDGSRIMCFLYSNWDKAIKPSKSKVSNISFKKLMTIGAKYRIMTHPVKDLIEGSTLLALIDQRFIFVMLTLLVFMLPFAPTMILAGVSAMIIIMYVLAILLGRIKLHKPNLVDIGFFAFGLCYIYGTFTSYNMLKAVQVLILMGAFMLLFYVIEECIKSDEQLKIFINSLLLSGLIVALYGIYQYIIGVEMDRAWIDANAFEDIKTRVYSTFGNPNVLGEYLIVVTSLALGMLWKEEKLIMKAVYMGVIVVTGVCLLMTGSRASMLGLILAIGVFVVLSEKRILPLAIIGVLLLPFILPESVWGRLASITDLKADSSWLYRLSIYKASLQMIGTYWASGIGLESFTMVYPMFSLEAAYAYHSHNTFTQVFIELGIGGIITFITLILLFFQRLYAIKKVVKRPYIIMIGVTFGAFLGLLLQGLADHIWFNYRIVLLFWMLMGLGMAVMRVGEKTS